jgi:hypothetical protein
MFSTSSLKRAASSAPEALCYFVGDWVMTSRSFPSILFTPNTRLFKRGRGALLIERRLAGTNDASRRYHPLDPGTAMSPAASRRHQCSGLTRSRRILGPWIMR